MHEVEWMQVELGDENGWFEVHGWLYKILTRAVVVVTELWA